MKKIGLMIRPPLLFINFFLIDERVHQSCIIMFDINKHERNNVDI